MLVKKYKNIILSMTSIIFIFFIWFFLTEFKLVPWYFLPRYSQMISEFLFRSEVIFEGFWVTFYHTVLGLLLGSVLGVIAALIFASIPKAEQLFDPFIQVFRPIPALVLVPFFILWFGLSLQAIIVFVAWGCFFVMFVEAREAVRNVPVIYYWASNSLGATRGQIFRMVVLPSIVPHIIGGLRVAGALSFNLSILYEFFASAGGLGKLVMNGYRYTRIPMLFVGIICLVLLAFLVDQLLRTTSRYVCRWM